VIRRKEGHANDTQLTPQGAGRESVDARPAFLLALVLVLPLLFGADAPSGCGGKPPDPRVCQLCVLCKGDPSLPFCAAVETSGECKRCEAPPTTTTTTTQPPAPPTTTTTTLPSPLPTPTPTPNPGPTPGPTPVPTPPPVPGGCIRLSSSTCTLGLPGDFRDRVNAALSRASGVPVNEVREVPNWQEVIVQTMSILQVEGFCTSFDLDGGNCWKFAPDGTCLKRGLGSEMGLRMGADKTEFYQPITATKRTRWADARSVCRPAMDEESLAQTRAYLIEGPGPVPTPTPGPTPAPRECPVTPAMLDANEPFRADVKPQPGSRLDLTLWICGSEVVAALDPLHNHAHACLNFCCPVELDKGTQDCEYLWGKAKWSTEPPFPASPVRLGLTSNTNTVVVGGTGPGVVRICGSDVPEDINKTCWTLAADPGNTPICTPSALDGTKCQKNRR